MATQPTQHKHWWYDYQKETFNFHLTREIQESLVTREGPLCQRCSNLNFEAAFPRSLDVNARFGVGFVIDFPASLTCPLCSLTRRLVSEMADVFLLLRADASSTHAVPLGIKKKFHFGRTRLFCSYDSPEISPLYDWPKDPKQVDFSLLKQKFAQCKSEHGPTCGVKNRMLVEGLRVYNCLTNKLEEATTHTKYIALSYVWGSFPDISCRKPPEQCRTIRDAMQVVLRLGYEYLWVDQLCINQAGPHKLQQIQQMNRIYQNADLTIVAAAGDNSDFGIPGVQDRSRLGRERFKIGNLQFIETLQHPHTLLSRTAWKSRAWTFQEEKLSHRLLVFTERAAWFSCYITSAEEGFEAKNRVNYEIPSLQAKLALAEKTPRPPCGLEAPLDIDRLIEEYAVRLLTYTSDVVNAFSGILEELKGANLIVSHVWGSPIMPPIALPDSANRYHRRPEVVDLVRSTVDGFIVGLMWNTTRPESFIRRHGIPSWSWVGWRGEILLRELYEEENVNFGIEVFIERTDGQVLTWSEFEGLSYLENQSHLISRFIRLRAWTMDLRIEYHHFTKGYLSAYAVMQMLNGDELL